MVLTSKDHLRVDKMGQKFILYQMFNRSRSVTSIKANSFFIVQNLTDMATFPRERESSSVARMDNTVF